MTAEFTNLTLTVEKTLRHAFRKQAARCHEYLVFLNRMKLKYPELDLANIASDNGQLPFVNPDNWKGIEKQLKNVEGFSEEDKKIFILKYGRMLKTKKLFKRLNGDYELYR